MRIDAHQHYWKLARDDYGWLSAEVPVLYRDYLPQDLTPHLQKQGVEQTIVVQAAQTHAETDYLLSLTEQTDTIAGVVGWLDLEDQAYQEQFKRFAQHPKFVGFRVMIQEMPDASRVLQKDYVDALSYFASLDFPVDLLCVSHQLPVVVKLLDAVPGLRGVINHLAKPQIAGGVLDPWRSQMQAIAAHSNIYCKLSGMVTEADHEHWQLNDFVSYVRHVLDVFGPQRVMFGSDWPVCLLAADYEQVCSVLRHALPADLSEQQLEGIYGENAWEFYKLGRRTS